jgi:hypothetical protein
MSQAPRWSAIPKLLDAVTSGDRAIAERAAAEAATLLREVPVSSLPRLDQRLRARSEWYEGWARLRPADLKALARLRHGAALIQLAMAHRDGRVREEAIRMSAVLGDGGELGFLLLRLNDWAVPVRRAADAALRARLDQFPTTMFVWFLPLLDTTAGWGRVDDRRVLSEIEERIVSDVGALRSGLLAADPRVRRACLARAWRAPGFDRAALVKLAALDRDSVVLAFVERHLSELPEDDADVVARRLLGVGAGTLRAWALDRVLHRDGASVTDEELCDHHERVRLVAQRCLSARGTDVASRYRLLCTQAQGRRLVSATLGLGESGSRVDMTTLLPLTRHRVGAVRAAALRSLARIGSPDMVERCLVALRDERARVTRTARDLLLARAGDVGVPAVALALAEAFEHGRRAALRVLGALDFWGRLAPILLATSDPAASVREAARATIDAWLVRQNRVFRPPTVDQAAAIRGALPIADITPVARSEITAILRARSR